MSETGPCGGSTCILPALRPQRGGAQVLLPQLIPSRRLLPFQFQTPHRLPCCSARRNLQRPHRPAGRAAWHPAAPVPGLLMASVLPEAPSGLLVAPQPRTSFCLLPLPSPAHLDLCRTLGLSFSLLAFLCLLGWSLCSASPGACGPDCSLSFPEGLSPSIPSRWALSGPRGPSPVSTSQPSFSPLTVSISSAELLGTKAALAARQLIKSWQPPGTGHG